MMIDCSRCVKLRLCVVARTRLKFGERLFSVAAPRAWNRLTTELKLMRSTSVSKRFLKNVLVPDFLLYRDRIIKLDSLMSHRSSCTRN